MLFWKCREGHHYMIDIRSRWRSKTCSWLAMNQFQTCTRLVQFVFNFFLLFFFFQAAKEYAFLHKALGLTLEWKWTYKQELNNVKSKAHSKWWEKNPSCLWSMLSVNNWVAWEMFPRLLSGASLVSLFRSERRNWLAVATLQQALRAASSLLFMTTFTSQRLWFLLRIFKCLTSSWRRISNMTLHIGIVPNDNRFQLTK